MTSPGPPTSTPSASAPDGAAPNPDELLRSKQYIVVLVLAAVLGAPVAAIAYFFLKLAALGQHFLYKSLISDLGFSHEPLWWPLPLLIIGGLGVALTIRYLPGTAGEKPAEGLKMAGLPRPVDLLGVVIASLSTLWFGAVLGPEAPLIMIGGGLGVIAMRLLSRGAPQQASMLVAGATAAAAISTLLGNPLIAAFLLMEVIPLAGALRTVVLVPCLLCAGVGSLVFVGLDKLTGFGTFSLAIPHIPPFHTPTAAELVWAIGIGILAPLLGAAVHRASLGLQRAVEPRAVLLTPAMGIIVAVAAIIFCAISGKSSSEVLFSGQDALPGLIEHAAAFTAGTLVLLTVCKAVAYTASLSSFRGGPIFPALFIGAAGGMALSHLPGLPMIAGAAIGMAAFMTAMTGLPLFAALLTTELVLADGLALVPLVIVAVAVSYVTSAHLVRAPAPAGESPSMNRGQPPNSQPSASPPPPDEIDQPARHFSPDQIQ